MKTKMLRFASEADMHRERQARREAFNGGSRGRVIVPERDVLAAGLELMHKHPGVRFAFRMNSGSGFLLYADKFKQLVADGHLKAGDARFMRFGFPGCPDVIAMLAGGRLCFAEAKSSVGPIRDDQQAVLEATNAGGGLGFVFRSVEDVVKALA